MSIFSKRVGSLTESITLKLNAKASKMAKDGKKVYNLTAGQLPFRPLPDFVNLLRSESDFLHSFQYSPVAGLPELREKYISHFERTRGVQVNRDKFSCLVSNGGKHALNNIFSCLIDDGDEVIMLAPFWISYPQMVKLYGGKPVTVSTNAFDVFVPSIDDIKKSITDKTKMIIINSPNNPSGTHFSSEWMSQFAELMEEYPDLYVISDEIYYQLFYYDPGPCTFYQNREHLLERTIVVDGISKTMASTGLRIGFTLASKEVISAMNKLQGQTASGANSLVQRALCQFNFELIESFLEPIKKHLRTNAETLGETLRAYKLSHVWYQPQSAFYYLLDFSSTPIKEKFKDEDASLAICEELLEKHGIALVPGTDFGVPNSARLSLVSENKVFKEAVEIIAKYVACVQS